LTDHLDATFRRHGAVAEGLIRRRLRAARALAATGDIRDAVESLVELHSSLIDRDGYGAIGDARISFYRDVYRHGPFDPDIHDPDRRFPTAESAEAVRTAPVGGIDAHRELGGLIDRARRALVIASAVGDPAVRASALATWYQQQSTAIGAWARRTLSDSQMSLHYVENWLRLKPEFREDT
jgi:hypothetical protein